MVPDIEEILDNLSDGQYDDFILNDKFKPFILNNLQPVLDNVSSLENIWLKFMDHNGNYILTTSCRQQCSFCRYIRSDFNGNQRCLNSIKKMNLNGRENLQPFFSQCHAGLTLVAVPIEMLRHRLGYLAFGEIKQNADREVILHNLSGLNLNHNKLIELYEEIPNISNEQITRIPEALHKISNAFLQMGIELVKLNNIHSLLLNNLIDYSDIHVKPYIETDNKETIKKNIRFTIQKAREFINYRYNQPISLNDVADYLHINPSYFSFIFKKVTGYTFKNYITKLRIEKAKELLLYSTLTIKQISLEIGYKDSNYFNRVFNKMTGISPSHYINSQKKSRFA